MLTSGGLVLDVEPLLVVDPEPFELPGSDTETDGRGSDGTDGTVVRGTDGTVVAAVDPPEAPELPADPLPCVGTAGTSVVGRPAVVQ